MSEECHALLAHYCRAWQRHGVRFGITGAHRRLEHYETIFTVCCGTPEGMHNDMQRWAMERVVLLSGDSLVFRFPHGHSDRERRGRLNPRFLDATLLQERYHPLFAAAVPDTVFLLPVPQIYSTEGVTPAVFSRRLALFLDALPPGLRYALEVQNGEFLVPEYFELLRERRVAQVIGGGVGMPALLDRFLLTGIADTCKLIVRASAEQEPEMAAAVLEIVRRCSGITSVALLLEDRAEVALMAFAVLMERLNGELSRRSVIRKKAA